MRVAIQATSCLAAHLLRSKITADPKRGRICSAVVAANAPTGAADHKASRGRVLGGPGGRLGWRRAVTRWPTRLRIESLQRCGWPAAVAVGKRPTGRPPQQARSNLPPAMASAPQGSAHPEATRTGLARAHPQSVVFRIYATSWATDSRADTACRPRASKPRSGSPPDCRRGVNGRATRVP
jgi:hypothetical protein